MLKNALWLFALATVALVSFLPSYSKMQDLKQKNYEFQGKIERLVQENQRFSEEKRLLQDDPIYLEKVAREKMGLIKEGEMIFRLEPAGDKAE